MVSSLDASPEEHPDRGGEVVALLGPPDWKWVDTTFEWKNDNVQSFNTRRDETIIALKNNQETKILQILVLSSASTVRAVETVTALYSREHARLQQMVVQYFEQNNRAKLFSSHGFSLILCMRPSKSQAKRVGLQTDLRCGLRGGLGQKKTSYLMKWWHMFSGFGRHGIAAICTEFSEKALFEAVVNSS